MHLGDAVERAIHLVEQLLLWRASDPQEPAGDSRPSTWRRSPLAALPILIRWQRHAGLIYPSTAARRLVRGDGDALRALVRNLVDNAVPLYAVRGFGRVICERGGDQVDLEVIDSGQASRRRSSPGIRPIPSQAGRRGSGTGLGLPSSRPLPADMAHGGTGRLHFGGLRATSRSPSVFSSLKEQWKVALEHTLDESQEIFMHSVLELWMVGAACWLSVPPRAIGPRLFQSIPGTAGAAAAPAAPLPPSIPFPRDAPNTR